MINVNDYRMENAGGCGLYVGTYAKYNAGSIEGMWIDLETCSDAEEFFEVCRALHSDENDPEFMMQDFQGFPEELYSESMSEEDVEKILFYCQLDDDDKELLEAYFECFGGDYDDAEDVLETAKARSMGKYDSFREFSDQMAEEEIACHAQGKTTEFFERYFDYDAFERDLKMDYYVSESGYVFNPNF